MKRLLLILLLIAGARPLTAQQNQPIEPAGKSLTAVVRLDTFNWVDQSRKRLVPVAIYRPEKPVLSKTGKLDQVIILNHGYGQNQWGSFKAYSYLCNFLASKGYTVVSIQHELVTDDLLPATGKPIETRWPNWEREFRIFYLSSKNSKKPGPIWIINTSV